METHPPHVHHNSGKKFSQYFYEFLMLFLAVSCGFLAENMREENVEHNRENEYMKSMVEDLKLDTLQLTRIKSFRLDKLRTIDSLYYFFKSYTEGRVPANIYLQANKLFGHAAFFQNSGTLDQLRNSGGLRLIRHRNVVDSIESYDQQIKRISLRDIYETNYSYDHNKLQQKLFNGREVLPFSEDKISTIESPILPSTVKLNVQILDEYLNSLIGFKYFVRRDLELQEAIKAKAKNLINLINNEYPV